MSYDNPQSRNEAILQNILGADNVLEPPQSRTEAALTAILNGEEYTGEAKSRVEMLLKEISQQGGGNVDVEALAVDANGTYTAPSGKAYSPVTVDVAPDLMTKSVTANGTYQAASDNVDGYSAVTVDVEANVGTKSITQNGTYTAASEQLDGYSEVTVNVSGGGGQEVPEKDVNFIDYDGTVLYSYTAQEALALTALPANPSHEGLTAQGWNYTLAEVKTEVNAVGGATVGQMYVTDDGKTRIYCTFTEGLLSPRLYLGVNGSVTIDWGDGSTADTLTGSSESTLVYKQHTYASAGDYLITVEVTRGSANINTSYNDITRLIGGSSTSTNFMGYANCINKVELGTGITLGYRCFVRSASLKSITIPHGIAEIPNKAFGVCSSLKAVVIPDSVTSIDTDVFTDCGSFVVCSIPPSLTALKSNTFYNCYSLRYLCIPSTVTTIGTNFLYICSALQKLSIPSGAVFGTSFLYSSNCLREVKYANGITNIGPLSTCPSLSSITIPSTVTELKGSTFWNCYNMMEYHFKPTTPPILASNMVFNGINSDCKIYVPSASVETYKTATNWSSYASYIVGE